MALAQLDINAETANSLRQVAHQLGVDASDLAEKAIRRYLRQEAEKKIAREAAAYRAQHPQLLAQYADQYIAMHQGQVIDTDTDQMALFLRIRKAYPHIGILIQQVKEEPEEVLQVRSPSFQYR